MSESPEDKKSKRSRVVAWVSKHPSKIKHMLSEYRRPEQTTLHSQQRAAAVASEPSASGPMPSPTVGQSASNTRSQQPVALVSDSSQTPSSTPSIPNNNSYAPKLREPSPLSGESAPNTHFQPISAPFSFSSPQLPTSALSPTPVNNSFVINAPVVSPVAGQQAATAVVSSSPQVPPTVPPSTPASSSLTQKAKAAGNVVYEVLKTTTKVVNGISDVFPPLKAVTEGILMVVELVDSVVDNKEELETLRSRLEAILLIIKRYDELKIPDKLKFRIQCFQNAITSELAVVEKLQGRSLGAFVVKSDGDKDTIVKAFRNISHQCELFQIDTQLNTAIRTEEIVEYLNSTIIDNLRQEKTSYDNRASSYGDPTGCLEGTRVKILEDLKRWFTDDDAKTVFWMVGMAGTGKSTISHTLCLMLEKMNMLGGSFFGSRASEKTSNARLIVPAIAHALARGSPSIQTEVVKAVKENPNLADSTYNDLEGQLTKLIYNPLRTITSNVAGTYKIIVIDGLDECVDHNSSQFVLRLINHILAKSSSIPLKFFIASRNESPIRDAFNGNLAAENFRLHDVEQDVVKEDIRTYLTRSLSEIKNDHSGGAPGWPDQQELQQLIDQSGRLFVYAATAIRFIRAGGRRYKGRLTIMLDAKFKTTQNKPTELLDVLYGNILKQACAPLADTEIAALRQLTSIIIFLRKPLSKQAIADLSEAEDPYSDLLELSAVIHIPAEDSLPIAPFHASFPDFIIDPERCSPNSHSLFPALVDIDSHGILALKCLRLLNRSLKFNIYNAAEESSGSRRGATNKPRRHTNISEALEYSCIHWLFHASKIKEVSPEFSDALSEFLDNSLLRWIECLAVLGEPRLGLMSLHTVTEVISRFTMTYAQDDIQILQLLADNGRLALIQKYAFEIYQVVLGWVVEKSLIRLSDFGGPRENDMQNDGVVSSIAFEPNSISWLFKNQFATGSHDGMVRLWNGLTGEVEKTLEGHEGPVTSVAFRAGGFYVASRSNDCTVRTWNISSSRPDKPIVRTGHSDPVMSVAFSPDGYYVVSGSLDNTVRVCWAILEEEEIARLDVGSLTSVAFSPDSQQIVCGSHDGPVQIWEAKTKSIYGRADFSGPAKVRELQGVDSVTSIAVSKDDKKFIFGLHDNTIWFWDISSETVELELKAIIDT